MESVNVIITTAIAPIGDQCERQITSVSPKITLRDATDLALAEHRGDLASKEQLDTLLTEAEIIYGFRFPKNIIARAPKLKWIQTMGAGVDFPNDELLRSPAVMTNMSGIHATPIGEFVLHVMLMFVKQAPLCTRLKQGKRWRRLILQGYALRP